jgi:5-methyltetrahydropteroyltriglutamate--homocysteine methyltransferase
MSDPLFPTQEIGSLARPRWQLLGQRGAPLDEKAREELRRWNERIHFLPAEDAELHRFLAPNGSAVPADTVRDWGSLFGLRYLEAVGLDRVYDGEARRVEMYEAAVRHMTGFTFEGHVRSFDAKYYRKAAATGVVGLHEPYHLDEFRFLAPIAHRPLKLPVTGPYTIADWSFNEHYLGRQKGWKGPAARREAQREFVEAVAREAIRPTLKALVAAGCRQIQVDEPAAGTHPAESELVAAGFNAATEGVDAEFSMHICFSDYRSLFPALLEAKRCRQWALEFANRENDHHDPYAELSLLNEYGDDRSVGLGVLDVHRDLLETPERVRDRILRGAKALGDPSRIWANPDCGLRTRSLDVAWAKLTSLVEGARLARESLSGAGG